jgi:hypothetical protein
MDEKRDLLRHTVAAVAYRASRAVTDAPDEFGDFQGGGKAPVKILAHMGDLFDWSLTMAQGQPRWHKSEPLPWADEKKRFFASLGAFDAYLASDAPLGVGIEGLMQGPVSDAFHHIGQLAMLRRMAGCPVRRENFYVAPVAVGRVGPEQAEPPNS